MKAKPPKGKPGGTEPTPGATADDLPERWSVQRKMELVLRLLRGEALDAVSRESQVPAHELERWQRIFLEQGKRGLRTKAEPEERELILARAKIGELMMRLELAEDLIEKRASRTSGRGAEDEAGAQSRHGAPLSLDHDLSDLSARPLVGLCDPPRVVAGADGEAGPQDPGE